MKTGSPGFIGARLRQAREARGLTITALAELLGVTKQAVSQYENGSGSPRPEVLTRLASVLNLPMHFFTKPLPDLSFDRPIFYRSMSAATKAARARAEVRYGWIRELRAQLREAIEFPAVKFPSFNLPAELNHFTARRLEDLALETRRFWGLGDGPIPHVVRILESQGALIVRDHLDAETLDALSDWAQPEDVPFVVLNDEKDSAVRSRLDVAHELAHLIVHKGFPKEYLLKTPQFRQMEDQAFRFGAAFLLPERSFLNDLYSISLESFRVLKAKWKVSIGMMIKRVDDLGIVKEETTRRLWINYSRRGWRQREPLDDELPIEEPSLLRQACELIVRERLQNHEQLVEASAMSRKDMAQFAGLPEDFFGPHDPEVNLKILRFPKAN